MHDSRDAESLEDGFDNGESEETSYCSDDGSGGYDCDFCLDTAADYSKAKNYSILKEEDIRRLQANDIARVSSVFSISKVAATILLCHYNWTVSKVEDAWFNDEDRVRSIVGLLKNPVVQFSKEEELTCGICFDSYPRDSINAAACGHPYCSSCWTGYITTSINDGPACLSLKCPDPSCGAAVGQDMINRHASDEDKEKYSCYLFRSYIEDNYKMKWCPGPGCENAVNFESGGAYDVSCLCSYSFCWNCAEEAHRPVDCNTVKKWVVKNNAESNTVNWMIANSKACPNCKRPIEKGIGCMHMVCSLCKHEFCWLCLDRWSVHNWSTGGYYACNIYQAAKRRGEYDETESKREMARNSLERYTHYYERWAANRLSREKALVDLQKTQDVYLERISDVQCQPESQLKFITEAMQQIVECRRVLKWAYAYGYFIPENERAKRQFFEYLQGEAESGLERLHQCAENELQTFLRSKSPSEDFDAFRSKLTGLTSVTGNYFENLAEALENGLEDVDSGKTKGSSANVEANKAKG